MAKTITSQIGMGPVSVIVPVYNVQNYLDRCLKSIANQSLPPLEVLMVNDGSTDNSRRICEDYSENFENFRLIDQQNAGLSAARNTGLDHAKGEYVVFIDSDDFISGDMLAILHDAALNHQADMVKCGMYAYYDETRIELFSGMEGEPLVLDSIRSRFRAMFDKKFTHSVCNAMFHRKLFDQIRFPHGRLMEDTFITPKLLVESSKTVVLPQNLYYYRRRDDSIMKSFNDRHFDILDSSKQLKNLLIQHDLWEEFRDDFYAWFGGHLSTVVKNMALYCRMITYRRYAKQLKGRLGMDEWSLIMDAQKQIAKNHPDQEVRRKTGKAGSVLSAYHRKKNVFWLKTRFNQWRKLNKKRPVTSTE